MRATITSFGPTLLSKVLGLNDTQESSLGLVFHYADKQGLPLVDLKDLREVVQYLTSDDGKADLKSLGGLSSATAGVILRELIGFADQGAEAFFGETEFDSRELLRTAADGRGVVTCLELPAVQDRPALFSTFLMWLLADLFHDLPEVGDPDKPKLVFFFDEAHLLFSDASKDFLDAIQQTVRLIRSKGVGVFFVTQSPKDVPAGVLGQLGNRVQHALRAFTPDDARPSRPPCRPTPRAATTSASCSPRSAPARPSSPCCPRRGAPTPVAWTRMRAPESLMAPAPDATVDGIVAASRCRSTPPSSTRSPPTRCSPRGCRPPRRPRPATPPPPSATPAPAPAPARPARQKEEPSMIQQVVGSSAFRSMVRSAGTVLGREITRSLFGTARRSPDRRTASEGWSRRQVPPRGGASPLVCPHVHLPPAGTGPDAVPTAPADAEGGAGLLVRLRGLRPSLSPARTASRRASWPTPGPRPR